MKKSIIAGALAILLAASALADYKYGQCQAIAKSTGQRCKHGVSNAGDIYCWQHK